MWCGCGTAKTIHQGAHYAKELNEKLTDILKTDCRFVDDAGELIKAAVIDRAWKVDHDLVRLLLLDKDIKAKFFGEIEGYWDLRYQQLHRLHLRQKLPRQLVHPVPQ